MVLTLCTLVATKVSRQTNSFAVTQTKELVTAFISHSVVDQSAQMPIEEDQVIEKCPLLARYCSWQIVDLVLRSQFDSAEKSNKNIVNGVVSDLLFQIGGLYEDKSQFREALELYQTSIRLNTFHNVYVGDVYYRLGVIFQRKLGDVKLMESYSAFHSAIQTQHFSSKQIEADAYYRYAEVMRWRGVNIVEYIRLYKQATIIDPDHHMARVWYGLSLYQQSQDVEGALAEIYRVIDTNDLWAKKWAFLYLGDIYFQEKRYDESKKMYEQALQIDSRFLEAQKRLARD